VEQVVGLQLAVLLSLKKAEEEVVVVMVTLQGVEEEAVAVVTILQVVVEAEEIRWICSPERSQVLSFHYSSYWCRAVRP
jgi:hypothetical protein